MNLSDIYTLAGSFPQDRETTPRYNMPPVPADYPIELQTGPLVVGFLLSAGLFGTLSVQLYLYYLAFPKDRQFVKSLVYGIYILELFQTILIAHDAFALFGYGFGDLEAPNEMYFSWLVVPVIGAVAASVGQLFYAYRIFVLSRSQIVPTFIICLSLISFVAAIIAGVRIFRTGDITAFNDGKTSIAVGISCSGFVLCDIIIALCMTYYLMRSNTGIRRTRILITKLIRLTIETGSLTAVVAGIILILFFASPHQSFYVTPTLVVSKMYANTIYMVLNSRIRIMGGRETYTSSTDMEITTNMMRDFNSHSAQGTQRTPVIAITAEAFSSDDERSQISNKPQNDNITQNC